MSGAAGVLVVNIAVAGLFAAGYAILALANRAQRAALGFSLSYLIGLLSPAADLASTVVGAPGVCEWISYSSFLLGTLSITATFSAFHERRPFWALLVAILIGGLALRAAIWDAPRDTLAYGMAYQLPFVLAAALAVRTVLSVAHRRPLHLALAAVFGVIAAHYLFKPFAAARLGSGATLGDYVASTYALVSQASTGILLLAAGILLLLIVVEKAITESWQASETDPLSSLPNRRGFDRAAQALLARSGAHGLPVAAAIFDLDHFKRINDTFGHAVGDEVIAAFAAILRDAAPADAVVGRAGGEEFVMLLEGATAQSARLAAEAVRLRAAAWATDPSRPAVTVSAGVAERRSGESLLDLFNRADQAAYDAKRGGRDRVCVFADRADPAPRQAVGAH